MAKKDETAAAPKAAKNDGLAAKVRGNSERIDRVINRLEELFGFDLDGDGKIGKAGYVKAAVLALLVLGIFVGISISAEVLRVNSSGTAMVTYGQDSGGIPNGDFTAAGTITGAAIVGTGALTGGTLAMSEGYFDVQNATQLVFIVTGTATNVIDADIGTP